MKKICIIHHGVGVGGGLIALLGLIEELKDNQLTVISIKSSTADQYIRDTGVRHIILDSFFYKYIYKILCYSEAEYYSLSYYIYLLYCLVVSILNKYIFAKKVLKRYSQDCTIIHLNSTFLSDWAYASSNKKVLMHVREPFKRNETVFSKFIYTNISKYTSLLIAVSKDNANRVGCLYKTIVVYDPVVNIKRDFNVSDINISREYKYFLYLGGSSRIKGFEQIVKSLDYLNPDIKILVLGNIQQRAFISFLKSFFMRGKYAFKERRLIRTILNSKKVEYIGLTDNVFFYMKNSLALVSPFSRPHASLPILEAMSIGLPVISSNVGGSEELVINNLTGYIFENGNYKDLAKKINNMSILQEHNYKTMSTESLLGFNKVLHSSPSISSIFTEK